MSRRAACQASISTSELRGPRGPKTSSPTREMKIIMVLLTASVAGLSGCAVYVPDEPHAVVVPQGKPQGGPGNGYCPPGQAKKGNC